MKYLICLIILVLLVLLWAPISVQAQILKTDGSIGAVLHIDPEDEPIAGQPSIFFFEFKDKEGKFRTGNCDCVVKIKQNEKEIFSHSLVVEELTKGFTYTFPSKGTYDFVLTGKSKSSTEGFQSFTLEDDITVSKERDASIFWTNNSAHLVFALLFATFIGVLLIFRFISRKKRLLIFIMVTIFCSLRTQTASAHLIGQPPFFKINGVYSNLYPVPTTSLQNFDLPQDLAPASYLVNQPLDLELDKTALPVPNSVIEKTTFRWDLGDGTKEEGLKNKHSYSKAGPYLLKITAQYITDPQAQLFQSVLLNILPSKDYQLPTAVVKVNGKKSINPLTDVINASFNQPIQLDASESQSKSSKIVSYFWDFGDQSSSKNKIDKHPLSKDLYQTFVVLRVWDAQGFYSDIYTEVDNADLLKQNPVGYVENKLATPTSKKSASDNLFLHIIIAGAIFIAFGLLLFLIGFLKRQKKTK